MTLRGWRPGKKLAADKRQVTMKNLMTVLAGVLVTGMSSAAVSKTGPSAEGFLARS